MNNSGLTAADVLSLTKDNDGFGGVGLIILLFIFLMAISGGNWGFGGNGATALGQSDLQNSLYFQSQDAAIRGLAQGQCNLTDAILSNKYDNAVLIKDLSNQISQQTATITGLFNEQTIDRLRDQVSVLRNENSNLIQTAQITENILGNLATTAPKPPCYYGCGGCGCNSLY
jgi:hypothetical protein